MLARVVSVFILVYANVDFIGGKAIEDLEVEKFSDFLKTVNYAEPDDAFDELDSAVSPTWELSGKFEGDIILSEKQMQILLQESAQPGLSRNGLNDVSKKWPGKTLVYKFNKGDFTSEQMDAIKDGMAELERSSCVKFKEKGPSDDDYVQIQGKRRGCYSRVGYHGGAQPLNLSPHPVGLGCMSHGTIVHELLHALGFFHMQSHSKRDNYIKIQWDNIIRGRENNFKKYNSFSSTDFGVPYDYDSVLHYSAHAFSKNGKKTIVPKDSFVTIGQRVGPSDKDMLKLNRMYECGGSSKGSGSGIEEFDSDLHEHGYRVLEGNRPDNVREEHGYRVSGDNQPDNVREEHGYRVSGDNQPDNVREEHGYRVSKDNRPDTIDVKGYDDDNNGYNFFLNYDSPSIDDESPAHNYRQTNEYQSSDGFSFEKYIPNGLISAFKWWRR